MTSATAHIRPTRPFRLSLPARRLLGGFLALHGLAHLAGTSDAFSRASDGRSIDYLAGGWTVSDPTVLQLLGVAWALLAAAFVIAAVVTWTGATAWPRVLAPVALASLTLVVLALWASVIGVVIDLALLATASRAGAKGGRHDNRC
jgi:hypothetical protein